MSQTMTRDDPSGLFSLAHLTLINSPLPELVYIASRAGYDAVMVKALVAEAGYLCSAEEKALLEKAMWGEKGNRTFSASAAIPTYPFWRRSRKVRSTLSRSATNRSPVTPPMATHASPGAPRWFCRTCRPA